ncbi:MAG: hypothetical protein M5U28_53690 [Sandaracinaceae bacterium]|nr:hypothetical protein [Sandaracinaceae bacterium]
MRVATAHELGVELQWIEPPYEVDRGALHGGAPRLREGGRSPRAASR